MFGFPGPGSSRPSARRYDNPPSSRRSDDRHDARIQRYDSVRGYPVPLPSRSHTTRESPHRQPFRYGVDLGTLGGEEFVYESERRRRPTRYDIDLDTLGGGASPFSSDRRSTREHHASRTQDYQIDDRQYNDVRGPTTRRRGSLVDLEDGFARLKTATRGRQPEYGSNRDRYHSSSAEVDRVEGNHAYSPRGFEFNVPSYSRPSSDRHREREVSPFERHGVHRSHAVRGPNPRTRRYYQDELFFD